MVAGHLTIPEHATGIVVFAQGSGSSRHSPRNRDVAEVLNRAGLVTLLFDLLTPAAGARLPFESHDRVSTAVLRPPWHTPQTRQACVEVACALEGLPDAYAIAASTRDRRTADYRRCIKTALSFLVRAQRMTDCTDRERGGFGGSLASREQRIDITGHVASGFVKSIENGITEP